MGPGARQPVAQALPAPGHVIADKYAIVRVIGEGGMGVVFEATHLKLRQRVAVKMLQPSMLEHQVIVTRFEREARAAGQLRNRHAARVMDVDVTDDGLPYMVMEYLEGHDLQTELESRGRLHHEEVVDYVLQVCSAMMEAHQLGIVHRDLKPANLFLALDSDARIVKVLDFGISKFQNEGDAKLTAAESVIGTALYMSPEQIRSPGAVDARSDIWSLGIILYELLCGQPPWLGTPTQLAAAIVSQEAPDLRTLVDVPVEIAAIVMKTLQRNPDHRYQNVKQLALALAPFAPQSGPGRMIAEGLLAGGSSGMFARPSFRPSERVENGRTISQANAVSQSQGNIGGTAPGWSQQSSPSSGHRTAVVGFIVAFALGLLVLGGSAFAWLRWRSPAPDRAATAPSGSTAPGSAAAASLSPADPLPPVIDPAPPTTGQRVASAPPPAETTVRPAVPTAKPSARPAAPTTPTPKPPPAPSANPLIL